MSGLTFTSASARDASTGLRAWLSFELDGHVRVDGVALRETREGRYTLSWPERRTRTGRFPIIRPVDDVARRELERAIFEELGLPGGVA